MAAAGVETEPVVKGEEVQQYVGKSCGGMNRLNTNLKDCNRNYSPINTCTCVPVSRSKFTSTPLLHAKPSKYTGFKLEFRHRSTKWFAPGLAGCQIGFRCTTHLTHTNTKLNAICDRNVGTCMSNRGMTTCVPGVPEPNQNRDRDTMFKPSSCDTEQLT